MSATDPQDGSVRQIIAVAEKFLDAVPEGFEPWSSGWCNGVQRFNQIGVENRVPPKPEVYYHSVAGEKPSKMTLVPVN